MFSINTRNCVCSEQSCLWSIKVLLAAAAVMSTEKQQLAGHQAPCSHAPRSGYDTFMKIDLNQLVGHSDSYWTRWACSLVSLESYSLHDFSCKLVEMTLFSFSFFKDGTWANVSYIWNWLHITLLVYINTTQDLKVNLCYCNYIACIICCYMQIYLTILIFSLAALQLITVVDFRCIWFVTVSMAELNGKTHYF